MQCNVPSIEMGEQLVADKPGLMGKRLSRENPHTKKSVNDH